MNRKNSQAVLKPAIKSTVFVAVSLIVLLVIALQLGANFGGLLNDRVGYSAVFADASDMKDGDSVRVSGVEVGKITDISLSDAEHALVKFDVDRSRPLPADARLTVRYLNLTGDRYLEIAPGPDPGTARTLPAGGQIPQAQTAPALDLDVLLAGFNPLFEGLAPDQINGLTGDLVQVLQGEGGMFESILSRIGTLTNTLADRDAVIGQVIDNLNTVLGTLNQKGPELGQTIDNLQRLVWGLAGDRQQIARGLDGSEQLVSSVDSFLGKARGPLRDSVDQIRRVSDLANQGSASVDQVLQMLPGAYLRVSRVASRGAMYSLFICSLRVKLTGPDGQPIYTPMVGPSDNVERCRPDDVAPLETPEDRAARRAARWPVAMAKLKFKEKNPITIALVGVAGILVIIFGSFQVAAMPFIAGHTYSAVFDEAGGLNAGDKVKLAGVEAGEVKDVELEDGEVVVTFTVKHVSLGNESVATIGTQTLLGERNLDIDSRGPRTMAPGDRIPLSRTKSPYSITQGLDDLTRRTGQIDTQQLGDALDTFAETFKNTPDDLTAAFQGISRISQTIASRDDALRQLLADASSVTGVLSERSQQLSSLLVDGNALLQELRSRRTVITNLLADTTQVAQQVVGLNADQRDRLAPALDSLNNVIALLQRNEDNISTAVQRVSTFITGLGEGLEEGTSFTGYGELGGLGVFPTSQFIPALTLPLSTGGH